MSSAALSRWAGDALIPIDYCDPTEWVVEAADSWLTTDGTAFALRLHRDRFFAAAAERGAGLEGFTDAALASFWEASIAAIPAKGDWFPRVELQSKNGAASFLYRERTAPPLSSSVALATHRGPELRRVPTIKGPDLGAMMQVRRAAQERGADDGVILTPDGFVVEGGTTSIVWWRGDILFGAPEGPGWEEFDRVDSVTARSVFGLATALGVETHREPVTPAELDGTEVWALNALHGIRIVTSWVDGADEDGAGRGRLQLAELPGRLALWRSRREALRKPVRAAAA
ncbi:aminotransferase class IV [Leifsonia bigeumensis]|uniref:Aminotransferase class IV n=1 Tax=Leifsonella bigeumensis TaxID=433643 RepID=A0ABP7FRT7_9MICO